MTVIERLAAFASEAPLPDVVSSEARRCLLDWFGCAIAGGIEPPATLLRRLPRGDGRSRLLPDGAHADPRIAALINGTASHTVEVDDIFSPGLYHPGVVTVPAALALAEDRRVDGARLLRAIALGYEVGNRIARAVNPAHYAYWHTTATVGHFGAAAAASVVLGLDARRTAHALATVATMAAGLRHAFSADAMSKPLHAGRAAEAGVFAALAAAEGVTGVADILEGARGFGAAMSEAPDWAGATTTLGTEWTILATTRKAHACCGHSFAALDAVVALTCEHGLAPEEIAAIEIAGYPATVEICGNPEPRTAAEARFSLPFCAAIMARTGAVTPASFAAEALSDPATRALAARVALSVDPEAKARFPALRGAFVVIRTADGRRFERRRVTRRGDPDDPLADAEIAAKFHALADPVIGPPSARALAEAVARIDAAPDAAILPLGSRNDAAPVA
jgi:2-methylcitrate dehydratase PrpD